MEKERSIDIREGVKGILSSINILDVTTSSFILINDHTEIVYQNFDNRNITDNSSRLINKSMQPGDLFECANAAIGPHGCGTSVNCPNCIFRNTIKNAITTMQTESCNVVLCLTNNRMLAVKALINPLIFDNRLYVAIFISNIYDTMRKQMIEKVFFHDIMNLASSMKGYVDLINDSESCDSSQLISQLQIMSDQLIKEIQSQKDLIDAEHGSLKVSIDEIDLHEFIEIVKTHLQSICSEKQCILEVDSVAKGMLFRTDQIILERVLYNMLKNAIEHEPSGGIVSLKVDYSGDEIRFSVHNSGIINPDIRDSVFQFGSTTKGIGHGIGTYSMKLLGEELLQGKVWFESNEQEGTTFYITIPKNY